MSWDNSRPGSRYGVEDLALAHAATERSANLIAAWLAQHPPSIASPASRLFLLVRNLAIFLDERRGGIVSFEIANAGQDEVFRFLDALEVFLPGTSLGDVYGLAVSPMSPSRAR
ncbi:MAG: hypothetical protein R2855_04755 [Thermomicrobiales bacterium]